MSIESAVHDVIERLVEAWNRHDWPSFSRLFAEDADYVTGAGLRLAGRVRILDELSSRASSSAPDRVTLVTDAVKILRPDVVVALCSWRMAGQAGGSVDGPDARAGILTLVIRRAEDGWRIVSLHSTDRSEPR